jgi:predicted transcriptional regulator
MGQEDILNTLKEEEWMSVVEIHQQLKITRSNISTQLNKLYKQGEVSKKIFKDEHSYREITKWRKRLLV